MTSTARSRAVGVLIPAEHGGWSLTLEPVLLGLLVSPSWAGAALGGGALSAFLLRTPLKLAVGDRLRRRTHARTRLADRGVAFYFAIMVVLLAAAWLSGDPQMWLPLLTALPLFAVEIAYDVRAKSRRFLPEMLGTIGIGSVAAAIVLADGGSTSVAWGLWAVVAARAIAAIPFVRVQLRRSKTQAHRLSVSDGSQAVAVIVATGAVTVSEVPWPALAAIAGLAAFHLWAVRRPVPRVAILGAQQVVLGLTVVLVTALAVLAP